MDEKPSANGDNDRDAKGQFAEGNPGGPGNPHAAQVAKLRSALLGAVSAEDVKAVILDVLKRAKEGNLSAAKMILDYTIGRPRPAAELLIEAATSQVKVVYIDGSNTGKLGRGELLPGLPAPDAFAPEDDDNGEDVPGLQTGSISVQDAQYRG